MGAVRLAFLLTATTLLGQAATLQQLSLEEMTQKSTAILRGRVTGTYSSASGSIIYTHYKVHASEWWKGSESADVDVAVPGGTFGGMRQTFGGAPNLNVGGEYLLFLWTGPSGVTTVIGLSQGVFDLSRDGKAGQIVSRPATSETMLDALGRLVADQPVRMTLQSFREKITTTLARGASR